MKQIINIKYKSNDANKKHIFQFYLNFSIDCNRIDNFLSAMIV